MCVINYPALPKIESWVHHWVQRSKMWEWDTTLGRGLGNNSREEKLLVVLDAISNFAFDRYLYCVRELCICICHCHCSAQNQTNVCLRCAPFGLVVSMGLSNYIVGRETMTTTRESPLFFFSKKKGLFKIDLFCKNWKLLIKITINKSKY